MKQGFKKVICFFKGHPCAPTGRRGYLLVEHECLRCGGVFISHIEYGNMLIPADADSDSILKLFKDGALIGADDADKAVRAPTK